MAALWSRFYTRTRSAANPNLEVVKFGLYVTFPLAFMAYFGDPSWYEKYVSPFRDSFAHPELQKNRPPRTQSELQEKLSEYRGARRARVEDKGVVEIGKSESPQPAISTTEPIGKLV